MERQYKHLSNPFLDSWFHQSGEEYTSPKPLFQEGFCVFMKINVYFKEVNCKIKLT